MITHARALEMYELQTQHRSQYLQAIANLEAQLAHQRECLLKTEGAMAMAKILLEDSEQEGANVQGILNGLKRGVISLDEVAVVENDLKIDLKERSAPAEQPSPPTATDSNGATPA